MKKYLLLISLLFVAFGAQAQKDKIFFYELDVHDGLLFRPNTIEPFSGLAYEEYPDGKKKMHIPIQSGKIHGKVTEWEKNGEKISEAEYNMGVQIGTEKQWYATGDKKLEISYTNGKANGVCTEWYKNGAKKSEGFYIDGKEDGDHYWWYLTGEKDQLISYKNGVVQGKVLNWHRNGNLKLEKEFANGVEEGITAEYYESGQPHSRAQFKNNQPHGETRFWSKKGLLLGIQTFEEGILVKDINYRSGSIHIPGGYLQVFNEKESFFTVKIVSEKVSPRKSTDIIYVVDGLFLQLINYSSSLFTDESNAAQSEKDILENFQKKEAQLIREKTGFDIQVKSDWFTTAQEQQAIHWQFKSPSSENAEQTPRTVQEEHYVSLLCNKEILSLYGVVTNEDTTEKVAALLKRIADTVEQMPERIDLNTLAK
jgi:antitoxin component YwqK of YwqJK toxin-antitoxin module